MTHANNAQMIVTDKVRPFTSRQMRKDFWH